MSRTFAGISDADWTAEVFPQVPHPLIHSAKMTSQTTGPQPDALGTKITRAHPETTCDRNDYKYCADDAENVHCLASTEI
jgi:hypothetical protein